MLRVFSCGGVVLTVNANGEHFLTMNLRGKNRNVFLRILAAGCLLLWLAALGFCSTEALIGHHDETVSQKAKTKHSHSESPDSKHREHRGCDDDPLCVALHSVNAPSPTILLAKPVSQWIATIDFAPLIALTSLEQPAIDFPRQQPDRIPIFTPEVYLGPAFRSHAPPTLV